MNITSRQNYSLGILEVVSFHKQQKYFCLQPLTPPLLKAPLKNVEIWGGGGEGGGGRRCRISWAYLRRNPEYAPAKT